MEDLMPDVEKRTGGPKSKSTFEAENPPHQMTPPFILI